MSAAKDLVGESLIHTKTHEILHVVQDDKLSFGYVFNNFCTSSQNDKVFLSSTRFLLTAAAHCFLS